MLCFLWMWTFTKCRENGDVACNRFTRPHLSSSSSWWGLTGPVPLSLYNPQRPTPTLSFLNHSDPTHLEPMCFSILSSTVVISNQPRSLKLLSTPLAHQRGLFTHLIPDRRWELKYYLPFLRLQFFFFWIKNAYFQTTKDNCFLLRPPDKHRTQTAQCLQCDTRCICIFMQM